MGVKGRDGFLERVGPGSAVAIWYLCAIVGNNAGKAVLPVFPYPYTLSVMQFGMGALSVPAYLALRGRPLKPLAALTQRFFGRGMFLGVTGILANFYHRVALQYISVSFAHTVKATQPLFSGDFILR